MYIPEVSFVQIGAQTAYYCAKLYITSTVGTYSLCGMRFILYRTCTQRHFNDWWGHVLGLYSGSITWNILVPIHEFSFVQNGTRTVCCCAKLYITSTVRTYRLYRYTFHSIEKSYTVSVQRLARLLHSCKRGVLKYRAIFWCLFLNFGSSKTVPEQPFFVPNFTWHQPSGRTDCMVYFSYCKEQPLVRSSFRRSQWLNNVEYFGVYSWIFVRPKPYQNSRIFFCAKLYITSTIWTYRLYYKSRMRLLCNDWWGCYKVAKGACHQYRAILWCIFLNLRSSKSVPKQPLHYINCREV